MRDDCRHMIVGAIEPWNRPYGLGPKPHYWFCQKVWWKSKGFLTVCLGKTFLQSGEEEASRFCEAACADVMADEPDYEWTEPKHGPIYPA